MDNLPTVTIKSQTSPITWSEQIEDWYREYFSELQTNGANPHIEKVTWEHWTRPVVFPLSDGGQFNERDENTHFIFGYIEALAQGEGRYLPFWTMKPENVFVEVTSEQPD